MGGAPIVAGVHWNALFVSRLAGFAEKWVWKEEEEEEERDEILLHAGPAGN